MNLIDRFDLEGYIQRFGARQDTKSGEWILLCPTCGKDKLQVNGEKKSWHCWVCEEYKTGFDGRRMAVRGAGGVLALIQLLEGCTKGQAVQLVLGQSVGPQLDLEALEQDALDDFEYLEGRASVAILPPDHWQPINAGTYARLPYLAQRGIRFSDVQQYGLFWCDQGRYVNRLIFPVWEQGQLVYWQARAMWEGEGRRFIKSLNPLPTPGMSGASEVLFNLDVARQYERVVLTEGPIDAIHVGPDAVATFGKKISLAQILKLCYAGVKAIDLMWDADAQREMIVAASRLSALFDVRLVWVPSGDPGEHSPGSNAQYRSQAQNSSFWGKLARL